MSLVNWAMSPTRIKIFVLLGFQVSHGACACVGSTFHILPKKKKKILKRVSKSSRDFQMSQRDIT